MAGRPQLLSHFVQELPAELETALDQAQTIGGTAVDVGWDGRARGIVITTSPCLRRFAPRR